ncbi:cation:proton antiporter [Tellurirhabdus rosea]|uniref:cation:proton antiporter n=1 Tax=Tellurirhabdus rosea TaxID=2674997 RepID=UPI00224D8A44|nr:cation:proton antiporter [Tellurirhabdus rosea]
MDYLLFLIVLGIAILGVAWLPSLLAKYPLSYPVIFVSIGYLLYKLPLGLPNPHPLLHRPLATHLTEICVIIALTSTGLKIDQNFSLKTWRTPLLLATVGMLITVSAMAFTGWALVGLVPAAAVLLGGALAPTDPVLAGDVQVGDPGEGEEDAVRFALTAEAGMNDGLAFPFIHLALALTGLVTAPLLDTVVHWVWMDVLYRVAVGLLAGWLSGRLLTYLIFGLPKRISIKSSAYGFVALAVTFITYSLTELAHGYGFLAVFVAAVAIRHYEDTHEFHHHMHDFSDQIERLLIVVILILFGGALANGLLDTLSWQGAVTGLLLLFVIRPLGCYLTLLGVKRMYRDERWVISTFGIRGIGSFFYLAYGIENGYFAEGEELWAIAGFVVLTSVFLHGTLATPVMKWLDRRHQRLEKQ